jgi:AcrR family transcriptional regulator
METRRMLVGVALKILEREGQAGYSTRAVCSSAGVSAPTLYHHFGSSDGLLSAALDEAFRQFLESKKAAIRSLDGELALRQGWDDYVRFAAQRPRLYAAMLARVLQGATIPAAAHARAQLMERIEAIAGEDRLAMNAHAAADLAWASANAAALLYVTAEVHPPDRAVVESLRDRALDSICTPRRKAKRP